MISIKRIKKIYKGYTVEELKEKQKDYETYEEHIQTLKSAQNFLCPGSYYGSTHNNLVNIALLDKIEKFRKCQDDLKL